MECPERERVILATHVLQGAAGDWWRVAQQTSFPRRDVKEITWAEFSRVFLERFFPRYSQDRKYREFVSLVQGDQSVEQYARRFYDLSKFASHRDERELAMKFLDSLSSRIHMLVVGHCCNKVDKAITATTSIEVERGLFLAEQ